MRLIRRLGRIEGKYYYGIFFCSYCKKEVIRQISGGKISHSCGCARNKLASEAMKKHGDTVTGSKHHKLYVVWDNIKRRCYNEKNRAYKWYGAKGIKMCVEWKDSYIKFKKWAIKNNWNEELEIDRKDNSGDYCPDNCRFITHIKNCRNRPSTKLNWELVHEIRKKYATGEYNGVMLAKEYSLDVSFMYKILKNKRWKE